MAIVAAVLQGGVTLGTTATPLYTAPAGTTAIVKRAVFANSGGAAVTVTVRVVRNGGSGGALVNAQSVALNGSYMAPELSQLVLGPGDAVTALCSAISSVFVVMSGFTM